MTAALAPHVIVILLTALWQHGDSRPVVQVLLVPSQMACVAAARSFVAAVEQENADNPPAFQDSYVEPACFVLPSMPHGSAPWYPPQDRAI